MAKIILFGDSIFAGYHNGFTSAIFKQKMQTRFPEDEFVNASVPGATTTDALGWVQGLVLDEQPDLTILFFGANDISVTNYISPDIYEAQLDELVTKLDPEKVVLVTPPYSDSLQLGDRTPDLIRHYVQVAQLVANDYQLPCVDLYDLMQHEKNPDQLLLPDGIHFTNEAYDLLADNVRTAIQTWRQRGQ